MVLAFDVKVERDAQDYADKEGIKIFTAEIIYHLFDKFTAYCEVYVTFTYFKLNILYRCLASLICLSFQLG